MVFGPREERLGGDEADRCPAPGPDGPASAYPRGKGWEGRMTTQRRLTNVAAAVGERLRSPASPSLARVVMRVCCGSGRTVAAMTVAGVLEVGDWRHGRGVQRAAPVGRNRAGAGGRAGAQPATLVTCIWGRRTDREVAPMASRAICWSRRRGLRRPVTGTTRVGSGRPTSAPQRAAGSAAISPPPQVPAVMGAVGGTRPCSPSHRAKEQVLPGPVGPAATRSSTHLARCLRDGRW